MPFIPVLRRQRQADLCEFKPGLVYRASSRTTRAVTQRNPVLMIFLLHSLIFVYVYAFTELKGQSTVVSSVHSFLHVEPGIDPGSSGLAASTFTC